MTLYDLDLTVLRFFDLSLASTTMDGVADALTNVHNWYVVYVIAGIALIYRMRVAGLKVVVAALLLIGVTDGLGHYVLKPLVHRERPCAVTRDGSHVVPWIRLPIGEKHDESFPSNHALNNFAIAAFFVTLFPRRKWLLALYVVAFLISVGRLYEGVHYPSDVLAGGIIGFNVGLIWAHGVRAFVFAPEPLPPTQVDPAD